jgi:hypothetical protein
MTELVVYTCVTGGYDDVDVTLGQAEAVPEPGVSYVMFSDSAELLSRDKFIVGARGVQWEVRPARDLPQLRDRRRHARWHKMHSCLLFPEAKYTLWVDGSQRFLAVRPLQDIVQPSLVDPVVLSTFKHPLRSCIYQEIAACIRLNKDNPELMRQQVDRYRRENYPPYAGLAETSVIARRNCRTVSEFEAHWWSELNQGSLRDQLSFNYISHKLGEPYGVIPGCREKSDYFQFVKHKR